MKCAKTIHIVMRCFADGRFKCIIYGKESGFGEMIEYLQCTTAASWAIAVQKISF